jgi:hypothetical protein
VRRYNLPVAATLGAGVAHFWGWCPGAGLVFGLALPVASTVVLLPPLAGWLGGSAAEGGSHGELLRTEPACTVFTEERELADAMTRDMMARFAGLQPQA